MVSFIGLNQKLARTLGQINFLIDCRTSNILPNFILNKTSQLNKQTKKQRIANQVSKLQKTLLNEEIKDAFRRKAFLQRAMTRSAHILESHQEEWHWLHSQGKKTFLEELQIVKHRLMRKLRHLCESQGHQHLRLEISKTGKLGEDFKTDDVQERDNILVTASSSTSPPSTSTSAHLPATSTSLSSSSTTSTFPPAASTATHPPASSNPLPSSSTSTSTSPPSEATATHLPATLTPLSSSTTSTSTSPPSTSTLDHLPPSSTHLTSSSTSTSTSPPPTTTSTHLPASSTSLPPSSTSTSTSPPSTATSTHLPASSTPLPSSSTPTPTSPPSTSTSTSTSAHLQVSSTSLPSDSTSTSTSPPLTSTSTHSTATSTSQPSSSTSTSTYPPSISTHLPSVSTSTHRPSASTHPASTSTELSPQTASDVPHEASHPTTDRSEPRFVNISDRPVSADLERILEKGPKYAFTQKVTPSNLQSAEAGIERAFYGLKWQHVIEQRKQTSNQSKQTTTTNDSPPTSAPQAIEESLLVQSQSQSQSVYWSLHQMAILAPKTTAYHMLDYLNASNTFLVTLCRWQFSSSGIDWTMHGYHMKT